MKIFRLPCSFSYIFPYCREFAKLRVFFIAAMQNRGICSLKWVSLGMLIAQSTIQSVIIEHQGVIPAENNSRRHLSSTAVICAEGIKIIICIVVIYMQADRSFRRTKALMYEQLVRDPSESLKICVPALLYTVQYNLLYLAQSRLDRGMYEVTYQVKIIAIAVLSMILLGQVVRLVQWISLIILTVGVAMVRFAWPFELSEAANSKEHQSHVMGMILLLLACLSGAVAAVYLEKLLKEGAQSIWMRNLQLGLFHILSALVALVAYDKAAVYENGFFSGYTSLLWLVIILQASGGLLVAAVMKYASNILKCYAGAVSVVLSAVLSYMLTADMSVSVLFIVGTGLVFVGTTVYLYEPRAREIIQGIHMPQLRDRTHDQAWLPITRV